MDVLDTIFPETDEPVNARCSECRRWFLPDELDFCRNCDASVCLGCTVTCDCGDKVCMGCWNGSSCITCHGEYLDRQAVARIG